MSAGIASIISKMAGAPEFQAVKEQIASNLTPEELPQVAPNFAAMGAIKADALAGKDMRTQLYESLQNNQDQLSQTKASILSGMAQDQSLTKPQVAAMMLIGLMPTLIGAITKGKRGVVKGAEAGALGVQSMSNMSRYDQARRDKLGVSQLEGVQDQMTKNADTMNKSALDQLNNADQATQKGLDREATLGAASIRAGGDKAVGAALTNIGRGLDNISKGFRNEKESETSKGSAKAFTLGDGDIFVPAGRVDDDKAKETTSNAGVYKNAITQVGDLVKMTQSMDAPMFERMVGNKSDKMFKKFQLAQQSIQAAKNLPGNESSKTLQKLDELLADPTSFRNNLTALLPGTAGIEDQLANTEKLLADDYKQYLSNSGYTRVKTGSTAVLNGKPVKITGVLPSGQLQWEAIQTGANYE